MKKYFYMAVAAIAALSSCSSDNDPIMGETGKQALVFTAKAHVPHTIVVKSARHGKPATRSASMARPITHRHQEPPQPSRLQQKVKKPQVRHTTPISLRASIITAHRLFLPMSARHGQTVSSTCRCMPPVKRPALPSRTSAVC